MSVYDKIQAGDYTPKQPFPARPHEPTLGRKPTADQALAYAENIKHHEIDMAKYRELIYAYNRENGELFNRFKADAINEAFGDDAARFPAMVQLLWELAWGTGHALGYSEVLSHLVDFAPVIDAVKRDMDE